MDPERLWSLAESRGYALELSYTGSGADGRMDGLFRRREAIAGSVYWPQRQSLTARPWPAYGTNPMKGRLGRAMIPELKERLSARLPDYMVPSVYVLLDELPLGSSGKVDRRALPVPGDVREGLGAEYVAPRGEVEQELARIWSEVLHLERVGVRDNFFDLGGHSLLATQVVSRIRKVLEFELPLTEMLSYPTVANLAQKIELIKWTGQQAPAADSKEREVFRP